MWIVAGLLIGAVVGAVGAVVSAKLRGEDIDWHNVVAAGVSGAVAGAIIAANPLTAATPAGRAAIGAAAGTIGGAVAGAVTSVTNDLLKGETPSLARAGKAALVGGVGGAVAGGIIGASPTPAGFAAGGVAGALASQGTQNLLEGRPLRENMVSAAGTGLLLAGAGYAAHTVAPRVLPPRPSAVAPANPRETLIETPGASSETSAPVKAPAPTNPATLSGERSHPSTRVQETSNPSAIGPSVAQHHDVNALASATPATQDEAPPGSIRTANLARGPPQAEPQQIGIVQALETGKVGNGDATADGSPTPTETSPTKTDDVYRGIHPEDPQYWALREKSKGDTATVEPAPTKGRGGAFRQRVWTRNPDNAAASAGPDGVVVRRALDGTETPLPHDEVHVEGEQTGEIHKAGVPINEEFGEPNDIQPPKDPLDDRLHPKHPESRPLTADVEAGEYVYVRDPEGQLHIAPNGDHHHPTVLGNAQEATAAGTIKIGAGGEILDITNDSGTFQFKRDTLNGVRTQAVRQGLRWTANSRLTPQKGT